MEINEYQKLALTTLNKELNEKEMLTNGLMGLSGESGEAIDLLKKHLFHSHPLDKEKLILELGDIAWYLAEASFALGISLEEVLTKNIEKLKKRYPEGFSKENSINRKI
jgi:NTP pyrophosphatase (non-canonical NTP hydrolase)